MRFEHGKQRRILCLIGGVEQREIVIVDYNPAWPSIYERRAGVIGDALGETLLRREHIGSTSVLGLAAKPIIDILAVVPDSADESSHLPQLEAAGYVLRVREPDFFEHRMLRTAARDIHVHVYSPETPEIRRNLTCRWRCIFAAVEPCDDPIGHLQGAGCINWLHPK